MVKTFQVGQHVVGALRNIENFQGIVTAIVQDGNKQKYQVRFENGLIGEYTNRGINAAGENRDAVHNIQPGDAASDEERDEIYQNDSSDEDNDEESDEEVSA